MATQPKTAAATATCFHEALGPWECYTFAILNCAGPALIDCANAQLVFKTEILNEHLICSLCMGYLRDAMSITECLHTCAQTSCIPEPA